MIINRHPGSSSFSTATATEADISAGKTAYGASGIMYGTATMIGTFSSIPTTKKTDYIVVNGNYYKWSETSNQYVLMDGDILSSITAVPTASSYEYDEVVSATVTAHYTNGSSHIISGATITPSTATKEYLLVSYTENGITHTCIMHISIKFADTSYTGDATVTDEGNGNWLMMLETSGTLTVNSDMFVDIYAVGGGGAGGYANYGSPSNPIGGGGGGYTDCIKGYLLTAGTYIATIGNGGAVGTAGQKSTGNNGTISSFGNIVSANGGNGGCGPDIDRYGRGGDGGSGGGGGIKETASVVGSHAGGSDGSDGFGNSGYGLTDTFSVRDFWESGGTLRAGGGGGCTPTYDNSFSLNNGGIGGGGSGQSCGRGTDGEANTGGGGGGGSNWNRSGWTGQYTAGAGGSGVILIRNARRI